MSGLRCSVCGTASVTRSGDAWCPRCHAWVIGPGRLPAVEPADGLVACPRCDMAGCPSCDGGGLVLVVEAAELVAAAT